MRAAARDGELTGEERISHTRVAAVLSDTFRASSAVECMNSVPRMRQLRHRRMTQPMLDLKRLYWNTRPFRSGPRKDVCPYQRLGLPIATYDFWELLEADPARLTQQLSTQGDAKCDNPSECLRRTSFVFLVAMNSATKGSSSGTKEGAETGFLSLFNHKVARSHR